MSRTFEIRFQGYGCKWIDEGGLWCNIIAYNENTFSVYELFEKDEVCIIEEVVLEEVEDEVGSIEFIEYADGEDYRLGKLVPADATLFIRDVKEDFSLKKLHIVNFSYNNFHFINISSYNGGKTRFNVVLDKVALNWNEICNKILQ